MVMMRDAHGGSSDRKQELKNIKKRSFGPRKRGERLTIGGYRNVGKLIKKYRKKLQEFSSLQCLQDEVNEKISEIGVL